MSGSTCRDCALVGYHCGSCGCCSDSQERVARIAEVLNVHRWKSMGVSSVECECGEILYGNDSLTQFPADEAFRNHVAAEVLRVFSPEAPDA